MNNFYVYIHKTFDLDQIFYVGKGKERRAWERRSRNKYWQNIEQKHGFKVEIVKNNLEESEALRLEVDLIERYRPKANFTKGGQRTSGFKHDPKMGVHRNQLTRDRNKSLNFKEKLSKAQIEAQNRPEVKDKIRISRQTLRARINSGEIPNPWIGRSVSQETKNKISESQKGPKGYWYGKRTSIAKAILNIDTGKRFPSLKEAAISVKGAWRALSRSLKRGRKFKGFRFKYV